MNVFANQISRIIAIGMMPVLLLTACHTTKTTTKTPTPGTTASAGMQLRKNVVAYAKKYVGSGYKYAGTSPSTGFDCSGFTSYVLKEYGITVSPASAMQAKEGKAVALDKVRPGDIIVFGEGSRIQHVALVVERKNNDIICVHSTTSRGVIVENVTQSTYWKPKILYARDVIGK